jgi:hypothetical protein
MENSSPLCEPNLHICEWCEQAEAEEAVAGEVVQKMGILTGAEGSQDIETTDPQVYSDRVAEIIGKN